MQAAIALIEIIAKLLQLGAQYLPDIFKYLELAYEIFTGKKEITPEVNKQIEDAHKDVLQKLTQAVFDREAEASQL